jgi:hypothetical protein
MAERNSIFDLADKFGVVSPFGDWMPKKDVGLPPPKIMRVNLVKNFELDFLNSSKIQRKDNFVLILQIQGYPDKVEVEYDGIRNIATSYSGFNYAGNYIVYLNNLLPAPFQEKVFTFTVKAYDLYEKSKVVDTKTYETTAYLDGNVKSDRSTNENDENTGEVKNIEYHIYYDARIEKHIPKNYDVKLQKGKILYFYHTESGDKIFVTECFFHFVAKRKNGKKTYSIPKGYIDTYKYPKEGDAKNAYVYENEDIVVDGIRYGMRIYSIDKGFVQLVRMPDNLKINKNGVKIIYKFRNSSRRFCSPEAFAGFIGALAEMGFDDVECTGMCFEDSTSYPSLFHPNGDSADTAYFNTLEREQKKVDAFARFHFKEILRGKKGWYKKLENSKAADDHDDHLHAGEFDSSKIKVKIGN